MKITPETFRQPKPPHPHPKHPTITFYNNCARFNPQASDLIDLPHPVSFDFDLMLMIPDPGGFEVKHVSQWKGYCIYSRPLSTHVMRRFKTIRSRNDSEKVVMSIARTAEGFKLTPQNGLSEEKADLVQEELTMLNPMP